MNTTGRLIIRRACPRSDPVPAVACAVPNAPASRVATCRAMSAGDSGHYSTCGGWGNRRSSHSTIGLPCFTIDLMSRLPFITFEGSEGCGKSTQVKKLATRFQQMGVPCLVTREPGGTPIGETIRELLQFAPHNTGMTPETELLLFEASRSQLVRETIKPALERGVCVIADRFFDSTTVYQGEARNLYGEMVQRLNAFAVGGCVPDITFVLDVGAATAESRMQKPRRADRMEQQPAEFHERVRRGYRDLAAREPNRMVLIDGSRHADVIENKIWQIILSRFAALSKTSNIEHQTSKI